MLPHPWARVLQRQGQGFGIQCGEPLQGIQRVQAALGGCSLANGVLQFRDGRVLLTLDQQALSRESPPAVGMGEKPNQAPGVLSGQGRLYGSRSRIAGGGDPIDSAPVGPGIEVQIPLDGLRDRLGILHQLSIDVHDVEVPVPAGGELNGPEPGIGGRQELTVPFFRRAAGHEADAARRQQIPVNQIPGDSSRKEVSPVGRRKPVARIDGAPRRAGEVPLDLSGAPQAHLIGNAPVSPGFGVRATSRVASGSRCGGHGPRRPG